MPPPYVVTPDIHSWPFGCACSPLSEFAPFWKPLSCPAQVPSLVEEQKAKGWNAAFALTVVRHFLRDRNLVYTWPTARGRKNLVGENPFPPPPQPLVHPNEVPQVYTLVDGQHRIEALQALQVSTLLHGDKAVPVMVLTGSTPEVIAVKYGTEMSLRLP